MAAYHSVAVARRICVLCLLGALCRTARAHDLERTQVVFTFAVDGSFVVDVTNDPGWLRLRLESIPGPFADRVVIWVDGREVRPEAVERIDGPLLTTHRLRGRVPIDSRTLRWFYGLVGDPYPLVVHRADGRIVVEEVAGNAWSREIDLAGQFRTEARWPVYVVGALALGAIVYRVRARTKRARTKRM
jgi:hypothetical protein